MTAAPNSGTSETSAALSWAGTITFIGTLLCTSFVINPTSRLAPWGSERKEGNWLFGTQHSLTLCLCYLFVSSYVLHLKRAWQVRYNSFHDQLVLTAGSDARVVLSSAASLSSEPFGKLISDDKDNEEGIILCIHFLSWGLKNWFYFYFLKRFPIYRRRRS